MIVYKNKVQMIEYPPFRHQKGAFLCRLIGVNTGLDPKDGDAYIEPVYMPTLEWVIQENFIVLVVNLVKPWIVILLYKTFPFITILKNYKTAELLEEDARD